VRIAKNQTKFNLASREGIEPSTFGFGDHCSAN
jgi:hypothetical protein